VHASTLSDAARLPRLWAAKLVALIVAGHGSSFEAATADPRLVAISADPDVAAALEWCRSRLPT
jgi:hypothetical protein